MLKIGIFDSGIGGLSFLKICTEMYPNCEYLYVGDQKHFPYGKKTDEYIINRIKTVFKFFEREKVDMVLVACNTASLQIPKIKENFPFKVYSVIDLIVANFENNSFNKGICIATDLTIANGVYGKKLAKYDFELVEKKASTLVGMIQNHYPKEAIVHEIISLDLGNVDFLILGCTHFAWIKELLHEMYPSIKLYDGTEKVKEIIGSVLANSDCHEKGKIFVYTTNMNDDILESLDELDIKYDKLEEIDV